MIQPVFEKINFFKNLGKFKEQLKVEIKTEIPSDQVSSILFVWAIANTQDYTVCDGKLNYSGKTAFNFGFLGQDKTVQKHECFTDFSGSIMDKSIVDSCKAETLVVVEKTEADLSGAFVTLIAHLTLTAELLDCENVNALVDGEGIIISKSEQEVMKGMGVKKVSYPVEEEFELNYLVKEVLFHRASAVITSAQSGVGSIIVDGQVLLSLVLLQNNDKNDIIKEDRVFPFRMEIECEEAMPNMLAVAFVKERSHKTDVSVDASQNKSTVSISVNLWFEGEAYSVQTLPLATDAFSLKNEVQLERCGAPIKTVCETRSHSTTVKGQSEVAELPVGATVVAVSGEKITTVSEECLDGKIKVIGLISAIALLKDGDKVFSRKLEVPFDQTFDGGYDCDMHQTVHARVGSVNARILSLSQMELEGQVYFTVYPCKKGAISVIKSVQELQEKQLNINAITVYIPEQGEQLWSLAKRLNVCPETLIATNKDLQFPLTGEERIVVYRGGNQS